MVRYRNPVCVQVKEILGSMGSFTGNFTLISTGATGHADQDR